MPASNDLAKKLVRIGVSRTYASQISREKRKPSLKLALRIFRRLGIKIGPLTKLTEDEIRALDKVYPGRKISLAAA